MCTEMPEARFEDVLTINLNKKSKVMQSIDPTFLEVCEDDTVKVISCVPSHPAIVGARVESSKVVVEIDQSSSIPDRVEIKINGIRRGFSNNRFEEFTEEAAMKNYRFWGNWEKS